MKCSSCAVRIKQALEHLKGIDKIDINQVLGRAAILYDPVAIGLEDIFKTVQSLGFGVTSDDTPSQRDASSSRWNQIRLTCVVMMTIPLVAEMIPGVNRVFHLLPWHAFIFATFVQIIGGMSFYIGAWKSLRSGSANMDVLVVLGTTTAYLYSTILVISYDQAADSSLYFESAAVIITLILLGKQLESRAQRETTDALWSLMRHRPEIARVIRQEGEVSVPIEQVRVKDSVIVRPGERIPVDGYIIDGRSEIDESLITGESLPILRQIGDTVSTGCINGTGLLRIQVRAVGKDTTLAKIIDLIEKAQRGKAPIQRFVDRVSAIFVPIVILIALLSGSVWLLAGYGLERALMVVVSVLVISCPCALGLATPTALVVGLGAAARAGILIRDIKVLELCSRVDVLMVDKTGTLTQGKPSVIEIHPLIDQINEHDLLTLAAAVQSGSDHPLATAIVTAAREQQLSWIQAHAITIYPGSGIIGRVNDTTVTIGNRRFLEQCDIKTSDAEMILTKQEQHGRIAILIAQEKQLLGMFVLSDCLRPEAISTIDELKRQGLIITLLSGDSTTVASKVAQAVGIEAENVYAPVRPEEKADIIEQWKAQNHTVAMIGDGINDAPSLACADVGIALGSGTDIAMQASDITLMRSDLRFIRVAFTIASKTWTKIRQNLFWAFVYNVLALPIAAFGLLNPMIAGSAMALSSLSVVSNSLRLCAWSPTIETQK